MRWNSQKQLSSRKHYPQDQRAGEFHTSESERPHEFWPRSIDYLTRSVSFSHKAPVHPCDMEETKAFKDFKTCFEAANTGELFEGCRPSGASCITNHQDIGHFQLSITEYMSKFLLRMGFVSSEECVISWIMNPSKKTGGGVGNQSKYTPVNLSCQRCLYFFFQRSISRLALFPDEPGLPKIAWRSASIQ